MLVNKLVVGINIRYLKQDFYWDVNKVFMYKFTLGFKDRESLQFDVVLDNENYKEYLMQFKNDYKDAHVSVYLGEMINNKYEFKYVTSFSINDIQ
jgi:hypothetical protein